MSFLGNWLESLHEDMKVTSKCSRTRNRKSNCNVCVEQCKYGAIRLNNDLVHIDTHHCNMCGECMIVCPLSAIEGLAVNRKFENGYLIYDDSYIPTIKELLIYKKKGIKSILVYDSLIDQEWNTVLEESNKQLTLLNERCIQVVHHGKNDSISRRGFLSSIQRNGKRIARNMAPASWKMEVDDWKLTKYYRDFQFYSLELDKQKCTLCQSCFFLCTEQVFTVMNGLLHINNEKCINCKSCTDVCVAKAIKITPEVKEKEERVESFYINHCNECGQEYFTFQKDTLQCPICIDRPPDWLSPH